MKFIKAYAPIKKSIYSLLPGEFFIYPNENNIYIFLSSFECVNLFTGKVEELRRCCDVFTFEVGTIGAE